MPLLLAALAALGLWQLRGASEPQDSTDASGASRGEADENGPAFEPVGGGPEGDAGPAGAEAAPEPPQEPEAESEEADEVVPLATVVRTADGQVIDAVRPCWDELEATQGSHQRVILRYTLVVEHGEAFAREPTVMDDQIQVEGLTACVLERVGDASWPVPGAPPIERVMQVSLSTADLAP